MSEPYVLAKGGNVGVEAVFGDSSAHVVVAVEARIASDSRVIPTDVSVLILGAEGKVRSNDDLVFYNQPSGADGAVRLTETSSSEDGDTTMIAVEVDLAGLPESVDRVLVAASIDSEADSSATFGAADTVRMAVSAPGDRDDVRITSELSGLSDERALVFGEIYRRDSDWKIRAVGQGYSAGLSGLVTEFGIDVDDAEDRGMGDEVSAVENERGREAAEEVSARADAAVALARRRKPVAKIPADWKERLSPGLPSAVHAELWQRARLFPTVGIRSSAEQEGRTTSVLLSVMSVVPDFGRRIVGLLGAPRGRVETFSEVAFSLAGHDYRPDGVIRVTRGAKEWTALVEVKTAKGSLGNDQVESYIKLARAKGYDAVVTISCDLTVSSSELPFRLESRPPKSVSVFHLSWEAIVTEAALQYASETGDRVQQRLLEELLLYAADQQSGMWSFGDMGRHWVKVRDGIADGTLAATDVATSEICSRFDHLTCHAAMQLTSLTGRTVVAQIPRATGDSVSRAKQLADSGEVFGSLKISGATAPLIINANLARLRIGCSQSVVAPRSGRTSTKVNWLIRQLSAAPPRLRIAAHHFGSRTEVTSALLETVRDDPTVLLPQGGRDIREFTITAEASMGSKRSATENGFVSSLITLVNTFHRDVTEVVKVPRQDA